MQTHWSLQDAQSRFAEVISAAQAGMPQVVTREGTPAVVVLAAASYQQFIANQTTPSFRDLLLAIPKDGGEDARSGLRLREVEF